MGNYWFWHNPLNNATRPPASGFVASVGFCSNAATLNWFQRPAVSRFHPLSRFKWTFPRADGVKSVLDWVKFVAEWVWSQTGLVNSGVQMVISVMDMAMSVTDRRISKGTRLCR